MRITCWTAFTGILLSACGGGDDRQDVPDQEPAAEVAEASDQDALPGLAMLEEDGPADPNLLRVLPEACTLLTAEEVSALLGTEMIAVQESHSGKESSQCSYRAIGMGMALNIMFVLDQFLDGRDPASLQAFIEGVGGTVAGPVDIPGALHGLRGEVGRSTNVWATNGMRGTSMMTDRPVSHFLVHVGLDSEAGSEERLTAVVEAAAIVLNRVRDGR